MNKLLVTLFSIVVVLGGCASPEQINQPATASQIKGMFPLLRNIRVDDINAGNRKSYLQISGIDRWEFKHALKDALAKSGWLTDDPGAKYVLKTRIVEEGQPPTGVDITVTSEIEYKLVQTSDGREFLDERVRASSTDLDRTREMRERIKAAQMESAKNTIAQLISKLEALMAKRNRALKLN